MGAYLSEPITDKISSDYNTDRIACGASSMQGWRVSQEDAHNCIIDFDENTSLFAVYDGHGGPEVALYCSQKLPEYIKNTDTYKSGKMNQALIDAYLGFDATIATREIVAELKEIAGTKDKENDAAKDEASEDEENVKNLFEEAKMPLEQVMEKYQNPQIGKIQSSNLKSRKIANTSSDAGSSSCSQGPSSSSSSDETNAVSSSSSRLDIVECSSSSSSIDTFSGTSGKPDSSENSQVKETNSSSDVQGKNEKQEAQEKNDVEMKEENESNEAKKKTETNEATQKNASGDISNGTEKTEINGDIKNTESETESKVENVSSSTSVENGQVSSPSKKGKALDKSPVKGVDTSEKESNKSPKTFNLREQSRKLSYTSLLIAEPESDSEDENDETFQGDVSDEDDEDDDDEVDKNEEEDEEESSSDDLEGEEDEEEDEFIMNMTEEPGSDSGCTAVVALLRGKELYVANAGDSRCIVCRKGKVIEMSFDHKPENEEETQRIAKAGGKVTADGRVNGGLNLSRAIGDHAYKQNKDLSDKEQMITALPDIKTLTITPEDEFMVLACDGIWNFMSSEDVAEFVGSRLKDGNQKISQICEEMFDHCLAPNTMGDGTGCDNMTAIIVQFKTGLAGSAKRTLSEVDDESVKSELPSKRAKAEHEVSAEPTSSKTTA